MNILFIGDIVGRPGRAAVKEVLPKLKEELKLDLVLANGENLAHGIGMSLDTYQEMREAGIDYFTSGNHIYKRRDFTPHLDNPEIRVIRPLNYPVGDPGRGFVKFKVKNKVILLINIIGRAFFSEQFDDPYRAIDSVLAKEKHDIAIVDHHAEATSNKMIMGHYLDGRIQAYIGTHTHIPTADAMILPKGTAYITDVGMVGPLHSSLGGDLATFTDAELTQMPFQYKIGSGDIVFSAVHIEIDDKNNKPVNITLIRKVLKRSMIHGGDYE
ncbi:MAG: TIGR00282 family metallophosphoesterase [bacterium]|nr:TIGR00282 family metallophosphoesterase [bacterium]